MTARRGDWIQTFTGRQFWPLDPRSDEIALLDVAAGLARDCRFGGHTSRFYSVAEHCVLMTRYAMAETLQPLSVLRAILFHDAPEGLGLRDLPRPFKKSLREYAAIEGRILDSVAERFDFPLPFPRIVKRLDERIGRTEANALMAPPPAPWDVDFAAIEPLPVTLHCWSPDDAMAEFIATARAIGVRHD